jgi:hypothetical protein
MKCSKCSEVVRPVVAIDIDGTLGDYHTHFINFLRQYNGLDSLWYDAHGYGYDGVLHFSEWCSLLYGVSIGEYRQIKLAYRQGGLKRSMPAFSGIDWIMRVIEGSNAELWVTTTRPYLRLDGIDPDTRFWLDRQAIKYNGLLYDEDKYRVLADRIDPARVVAVLDDLPEQIEVAEGLFGQHAVIHRSTTYNSGYQRKPNVDSLQKAAGKIDNRLTEWRRRYGH